MLFEDYREKPKYAVNRSILWEYDIYSNKWDWKKMAPIVIARVIQYGREKDYYAILQMYGGFYVIREILQSKVIGLSPKDLNWACFLFDLKKENTLCYIRKYSRQRLLNS